MLPQPKELKSAGQSFLTLVIVIGGIVLAAGVALALITASFVNSTYGMRAATSAEAAATAGAEDGLLQLSRNSQFGNSSGYIYSFAVGSSTATVTVTQPSGGFATVLSSATVSLRTKKIQVVVSVNPATGQLDMVSWKEIP